MRPGQRIARGPTRRAPHSRAVPKSLRSGSAAEPKAPEAAAEPLPERLRRVPSAARLGGNISSEPVRSFPNSLASAAAGASRSFPRAGVTGCAGPSGGGRDGERGACVREGLRKEPRFPERSSPASGSGKNRRLPSAGGPSGSGAARRRPSVRPAGLLEAAAAPCLMLRYFSEENPPASPESRRREGRHRPRGGAPRPPAAGGS